MSALNARITQSRHGQISRYGSFSNPYVSAYRARSSHKLAHRSPYDGDASNRSTTRPLLSISLPASPENAAHPSTDGGNPVRSRLTRRSHSASPAAPAGPIPSASNLASTNASIGSRTHSPRFTTGTSGSTGRTTDQCSLHGAPSAIHCRSAATSAAPSLGPCSGFGITSSSSSVVTRRIISDSSGRPGTIVRFPDFPAASAFSRYTNDTPPAVFTPP